MMLSKKAGSFPDERAHAIRTTAIAAAARITRAYSAVVCPSSRRNAEPRSGATTARRIAPTSAYTEANNALHLLSADRSNGAQQHGHHREEEEGRKNEEHKGEQHLDGGGPRPLARLRSPGCANVPGEVGHRLRQRRPERLGSG